MEKKENTLYQRLMHIYNSEPGLIPSTIFPEDVSHSSEQLAISLWDNYVKARTAYLNICDVQKIPTPLDFPLLFFYCKNSSIFSIALFPYGTTCKSNRLVPKTFPAFLTNVCGIPYIPGEAALQLFNSLYSYIHDFPRNSLQSITNHIRRFSPILAAMLDLTLPNFYTTIDGNLLFDNFAFSKRSSDNKQRFQSVFCFLEQYCYSQKEQIHVPFRLLKQFFSSLKRECHHLEEYVIDESSLPEILFAPKWGSTNISVKYDANLDSFTQEKLISPVVNLKTSFIEKRKSKNSVSFEIESFFQYLCASDIRLVEKLALIFADIFSSQKAGMTILLTHKNEASLQTILKNILEDDIVQFSKIPSINKIVKVQHLMDLFLAQFENKSIVFLRDILPTETNIKAFRRILNGRTIPVKSNCMPNQQYNNRLHFLCITSDRNKAKCLQKEFKATLVDFSCAESSIPSNLSFSKDDIHWFRTAFTLYGLKLQTLRSANLPDPSPFPLPIPSTSPSLDEELHQFLYGCCEIDPNSFCNTEEVYSWYNQFFQITHPGKKPVWSKIQFNKHLRELIAEEHKKNITYKRDRHSRSASSKYGYQGLKLSSILSSKEIDQQIHNNLLHDYLDYVSRYDIEFKDIMEVRVLKE